MAHFARIDKDNIVRAVHVVDNSKLLNEEGLEEESFGIVYLNNLIGVGHTWVQFSYNGNFRKNPAGIGMTYDKTRDAFIPPKPYDSWTLNEDTCQWEPPTEYPDKNDSYVWNEDTKASDEGVK